MGDGKSMQLVEVGPFALTAPMRNLTERLDAAFQSALNFNPCAPKVQKKSPRPKLTHPLSFYDGHLDRRLSLKNVKSISSFLSDLSQSVDIALVKAFEDEVGLPSVERSFPEPQRFTRFISRRPAKDANDIGEVYRASISLSACELTSMLLLHPTAARWSTVLHMIVRIVSRSQKYYAMIENYVPEFLDLYESIPEKAYTMVNKHAWAAMSDGDRRLFKEMRTRFPRMATPTDISLAAPPDAINTAWGTPLSSWISKSPVSTTDAIPAPLTGDERPLRRSDRLSLRSKLELPLEKTEGKSKQVISPPPAESKSHWPNIIIGSTGDAHAATIDFLGPNGKIISFSNVVVKLAFAPVQKKRLRHEFNVYSRLLTANARGIPHAFGLFEDIETEALALIMENAGRTLWDCRLPDKSQRHQFTISKSEKSAYSDASRSIHDAGVRHRDLRLENLTIKSNGDPCIIDFDRAEMEADERSLEHEKEKLQNILDGRYEYCISCETTEEDSYPSEEWESGTERSSSPEFRIRVLH
ncbi:hypothetical protein C0995_002628 [Termitomyces sp. Mi166|nr:hypothetical protein C0995_002628 [Termitomyces sp. Mi166\